MSANVHPTMLCLQRKTAEIKKNNRLLMYQQQQTKKVTDSL